MSLSHDKDVLMPLNIPPELVAELSKHPSVFSFPCRVSPERSCVDILKSNIRGDDVFGVVDIERLAEHIDKRTDENRLIAMRALPFATIIRTITDFRLPLLSDSTEEVSESYFSHALWSPLLVTASNEYGLGYNWEITCREGGVHGKGKMIADFGGYMVVDGKPCYTLLAEIERGGSEDDVVHKDFVVLAAEMRIHLERAVQRVTMEDIGDLRVYGLLLSRTSARLIVMGASYDARLDELTFVLDDNFARFDLDITKRDTSGLIEDVIRFLSVFASSASPEGTGITKERFDKPGRRINRKFVFGDVSFFFLRWYGLFTIRIM